MKMKMRTKIIGGLLCVFLLSVVVGAYGFYSIDRITNYIAQMEVLTVANNHAVDMVQAHHVWLYRITESFLFDIPFPGGLDPTTCIWGRWRYSTEGYIYAIDDAELMRLIRAVDHPHARLHLDGAEALRLREAGLYAEALYLLQNTVIPYGNQSTAAITALSNRYYELWREIRDSLGDVGGEVVTTILLVYGIGILAFVLLAVFIPRSILMPVRRLSAIASNVADGNINMNIDRANIAKDEIGALTLDVCRIVDVIRSVVDDLAKFEHVYNVDGDIEYRIDIEKYQNSFRDMVNGSNKLIDNVVSDVLGFLATLAEVNDGNFNPAIKKLPGKKVVLEEAIRTTTSNMIAINNELKAMIESIAVKGDLSFSIDADNYKGDWQEIMLGLNSISKAVEKPLIVIGATMNEMKEGNFDISSMITKMTAMGLDGNVENYNGMFKSILENFDETIEVIASYIEEITNNLLAISGGNLGTKITREYLGSFRAIKDSLNDISGTLSKTMSDISAASGQVLSGAKQIATSAQELANGAQEQASSVQELNASIDMISQQTRQNADNAATANELSGRSAANAQQGNDAMGQMVDAMDKIKVSSNNISKIVKTIQDIAFQTNLLALNASVEAARAGEHGKGFAVVADEVRSLAGRSQEAATQTTEFIQDSIERVDSGSSIAETTADSLNAIVSSVGEVLEIIRHISAASEEQAEAIANVGDGLAQISKVTQSNSAVSEQTAAASQELNSQAELLQQLVGFFRL